MSRTITDALQKVFLKLGGNVQDIQDNKTVTDYVDDLGEVLESLAELPGVTSSDNGKILKVINGKWNKGDAPSATFEFTIDYNDDDEWVLFGGVTFDDIVNAYNSGLVPVCYNRSEGSKYFPVSVEYDETWPILNYVNVYTGKISKHIQVNTSSETIYVEDIE